MMAGMRESDLIRGERSAVEASAEPRTRASLAAELRALGVTAGSVVLVHSSLSSLGWVCGGPVAVAGALLDAVGTAGTVAVPTHTTGNSDPAGWSNPPVPPSWWPTIREQMPAFDAQITPSTGMGAIAELVRTLPGARRSAHPQTSFAAVGPHAEQITSGHALDCAMGERSPLARIYDLRANVLLLGVGHASNSSFHLAEYRMPNPPRDRTGAAVVTPAGREWVTYEDVQIDAEDFDELGAAFDATGRSRRGPVGSAQARLFDQRDAVDFAVGWLGRRRRPVAG